MLRMARKFLPVLLFVLAAAGVRVQACSDFIVCNSSVAVSARTLDFSLDLYSKINIVPRGIEWVSVDKDGNKGLSWKNKYGFLGVNALGKPAYLDGMNEKGLSIGALWLDETKYPEPKKGVKSLMIYDFGTWILGNFSTVDEVKTALKDVNVVGEYVPELKKVPPLHVAAHDAAGKSIVIEFIDGNIKVYDNPGGVMTNSPEFPWQTKNVSNICNFLSIAHKGKEVKAELSSFSLPGDSSPVSRFVRAWFLTKGLTPPANAQDAVAYAEQIISRVSVVPGEKLYESAQNLYATHSDDTLWTVIRDHKNRVFYYKTINNTDLRAIDLKKVDFNAEKIKSIDMQSDGADWSVDVTDKLK